MASTCLSPRRINVPLPNALSICFKAASKAFFLSESFVGGTIFFSSFSFAIGFLKFKIIGLILSNLR